MTSCIGKWVSAGVIAVAVAWTAGRAADSAITPQLLAQDAYKIEAAAPTESAAVSSSATASAAAPAAPAPPANTLPPVEPLLATADPARGKQIAKACAVCHDFTKGGPNKTCPNLWGVVNAPRAHLGDGFAYSQAMKDEGGIWTYENLNAYLAKPRTAIPGTKMAYAGLPKPEDRAAVIAYLRTLSDNPAPLP